MASPKSLEECRSRISGIDAQIEALFLQRMAAAAEVAAFKEAHGLPVFDRTREQEILSQVVKRTPEELTGYAKTLFATLMELSRDYQSSLIAHASLPSPAGNCTVAIVGLGLLGTSLGMALRDKGFRRLAWTRRPEIRRRAVADQVADATSDDLAALLAEADVTVFALPLDATAGFLERYASCWRPGSIVTDVGSLKGRISALGQKLLAPRGVFFIGSHPMAGTEKSGYDAAFPTLYDNADVFLTPGPDAADEAKETLKCLWESIGCHPRFIAPEHHDQLVARTSHVLHILASALTRSILGTAGDERAMLERFAGCATGFKDTTRIASSNPAMWREIIQQNRSAVLTAMAEFEAEYALLKKSIQDGDFRQFESLFAEGKILRDRWLDYKKCEK